MPSHALFWAGSANSTQKENKTVQTFDLLSTDLFQTVLHHPIFLAGPASVREELRETISSCFHRFLLCCRTYT